MKKILLLGVMLAVVSLCGSSALALSPFEPPAAPADRRLALSKRLNSVLSPLSWHIEYIIREIHKTVENSFSTRISQIKLGK